MRHSVTSPATAVWERIVITAKGSEFTFCDHIVDGMEDMIVATSHKLGYGGEMAQATGRQRPPLGRVPHHFR